MLSCFQFHKSADKIQVANLGFAEKLQQVFIGPFDEQMGLAYTHAALSRDSS